MKPDGVIVMTGMVERGAVKKVKKVSGGPGAVFKLEKV